MTNFKKSKKKVLPYKKTVLKIKRTKSLKKNTSEVSGVTEAKEEVIKQTFIYPKDYPSKYIEYDKNSEKVWNQFQPFFFPGEEFTFDVSYLGIKAGSVRLKTFDALKLGDTPVFKFRAHMTSAKFYEYIYKIDDYIESYIEIDDFLP